MATQPTEQEYFERRLQYFHVAQEIEQHRFSKNDPSGFTEVIYSPKLHSCIGKLTVYTKDNYMALSVENLLTYEVIWSKGCSYKKNDCGGINDDQDAMMDKQR